MATDSRVGWDKVGAGREILVDVALGHVPADLVIANGSLVNVHTGRVGRADVAVKGNRIAAVGDVAYAVGRETEVVDAAGLYVTPGLVAPHFHQWHSNHNGTVVAQCLLERGTTAVTDGFYAPGIVAGPRGIRVLLDEMLRTPLKMMFLVPTHAYAQNRMFGLPPAPESVTGEDMLEMLEWPEAWGLEETGHDLLFDRARRDPAMVRVLERAHELRKLPTGHGINFASRRHVNAWIAAGIMNNHEAIDVEQAVCEAESGLYVLLRHAPGLEHIPGTVGALHEERCHSRAFQLCPDVAWADTIFEGHFDETVRQAVRAGIDPIRALQMATIQPAEFFRANHEIGSIAPGRFADIVLLSDLGKYELDSVFVNGQPFVRRGERVCELSQPDYPEWTRQTMRLPRPLTADDFTVAAPCVEGTVRARVIVVEDGDYFSDEVIVEMRVADGIVQPDPARGINLVTLIERLNGEDRIGVGFVQGFGLRTGAMASASNPMTQGIVAVAAGADDMAVATNAVARDGGAFVAVDHGEVIAELPTPILGMTCDLPYAEAKTAALGLVRAWRDLGCELSIPFGYLEFVAGTTEPRLRISTHGLVSVSTDGDLTMQIVPVVVD
ncbi:MAG: adenine deaminase C-terminal domain-containing protein [Solirubrobacteraceae bacterium]